MDGCELIFDREIRRALHLLSALREEVERVCVERVAKLSAMSS